MRKSAQKKPRKKFLLSINVRQIQGRQTIDWDSITSCIKWARGARFLGAWVRKGVVMVRVSANSDSMDTLLTMLRRTPYVTQVKIEELSSYPTR